MTTAGPGLSVAASLCDARLRRWAVTARPHRRQRRREIVGSSVAAADGRGEFNCRVAQRRDYKTRPSRAVFSAFLTQPWQGAV